MKHWPTFRSSIPLGRQARKQEGGSDADLADVPCLHLPSHCRVQRELYNTGTGVHSPCFLGICSACGQRDTAALPAPFAALHWFGFGSSKGGLLLCSRHRLQLAAGSQNQVPASRHKGSTLSCCSTKPLPTHASEVTVNSCKPYYDQEIFH